VELYGFQQNLAKLQMSLEKAQENYQALSSMRVQVWQLNSSLKLLCNWHCRQGHVVQRM
jgi:hypothetical protein